MDGQRREDEHVELTEFLLARIVEDEEAAQDAAGWRPSGRERSPGRWRRDGLNSVVDSDRQLVVYGDGGPPGDGEVEHIARWDPARVLAECEAKRRIVEASRHAMFDDPLRRTEFWRGVRDAAEADLRFLALPYADHPDYREEWRP